MAQLKIVRYGDPILRKKTKEISDITMEIKQLAYDMLDTMYNAPGVGLAAPQVGVSLQMCVIDVSPNGKKHPFILINPKIISGENKVEIEEGCLSFPGMFELVKRYDTIIVEYFDLKGNINKCEVSGFLARAFQHEIDHLNGKVFIDYLAAWKRKNIEKEIKKRKKGGDW